MSDDADIGAGTFLIASPILGDPNFARTVVLLCEHDAERSMGLVINRPSDVKLADALKDVQEAFLPDERIFVGGPVQPGALLVLHRVSKSIPGARTIPGGIGFGGDAKLLIDLLASSRPPADRVRVYAGYAGWGPGQLGAELEAGSWITCPADPRYVFETEPREIWGDVLKSLGGEYAYLANVPADPRLN